MKPSVRLLIAGALCFSAAAGAQDYPSQSIKVIVPFPPGSSSDTVTRLIAEEFRRDLGQPVTVENRAGGTGLIGVTALSRAAPDGYTIGIGNEATHITLPLLRKKLPYDPLKGFTPLTTAALTTMAIVINPKALPAKNLSELIELSKSQRDGVSFGTPGLGSPHHLIGELLNQRTGANFVHVPYTGGAPATTHRPRTLGAGD